jgi:hypothetical protein
MNPWEIFGNFDVSLYFFNIYIALRSGWPDWAKFCISSGYLLCAAFVHIFFNLFQFFVHLLCATFVHFQKQRKILNRFSTPQVLYQLWQNCVALYFGRSFHKRIWSPCLRCAYIFCFPLFRKVFKYVRYAKRTLRRWLYFSGMQCATYVQTSGRQMSIA